MAIEKKGILGQEYQIRQRIELFKRLPRWLVVKNSPAHSGDIGDLGLIPGLGRSSGEKHGKPLQYSCLENPMDRGAWWATAHGVRKSQT